MTTDIIVTIVLSSLSILLILAEIFLLPGLTITGIIGGLFSVGSIYYAFTYLGTAGGIITSVVSVVLFTIIFIWLIKSKAINKIGLETNSDSKVDSDIDTVNENDEGITLSRLNPIGKVKINGITIEGKSWSGFIDEGQEIVVVRKTSNQVVVKTKK